MAPRRMIQFDRETWPALSKLLDEWLDLAPESRSEWLANLGPEHQPLVPILRDLLNAQEERGTGGLLNTLPTMGADSHTGEFAAGIPIGPYRLIQELGHGGMGVVWLAERSDGTLNRPVALKLPMMLGNAGLAQRFARERDILAKLTHPHIARLYDAGMEGGQPYLTLEYVDGEKITTYCDRQGLGLKSRLRLFLDVLGAVQYAHNNLIVHRDLKPSNIMVTGEGEVRLLDFGIAKLLTEGEAHETDITRLAGRALTLDYSSPEQITGQPITTASDVYSLGVVLFELLTGEKPYRLKHDTRWGLEEAIRTADISRPSQAVKDAEKAQARGLTIKRLARGIKGDLDTIILKALQKEPQRRYATADAFAQDIERFLSGEAVLAQGESAWYRTRKFVVRNKAAVGSVTAVLAALTAGLGVALWQTHVAVLEKQRADTQSATAQAINDFLENDLLAQAGPSRQNGPGGKPNANLTVRAALDQAAARISGKFGKQPLVEASVRQTIGITYRDLGLYAEAQGQIERALALRNRVLGEEHSDTQESMSDLALLYSDQGKYAQAEPLFVKGLEVQRRLFGDESPITMTNMNNLGLLYRREDKLAEAELLYTKVLDVRLRLLGERHPDTQISMNNLAVLYAAQGKFDRAEPLMLKLVDLRRKIRGEEHPSTAAAMNTLAVLYREEARYAEAEALFVKVLEIRQRILGPPHPNTLDTMNFLAVVELFEGKFGKAEPLLKSAVELRRRALGENHPDTLESMFRLASLYRMERRYREAEPLLVKNLEARRQILGPEHRDTLTTMWNLPMLWRSEGRYAKAESGFRELLEIRRRIRGPEHPDVAQDMTSVGEVLFLERKYAEAEGLLREALRIHVKAAPNTWHRYQTETLLGATLAKEGRPEEAETLLESGNQGLKHVETTIPFEFRPLLEDSGNWLAQLRPDQQSHQSRAAK